MNISAIQGIIPPMVTPFRADGSIDEGANRAEVRHLIGAGVHGLAVCGSTGEGHTLTTDETRRITAWTVEEARGRVPVITGIITEPIGDRTRQSRRRSRGLGIASNPRALPVSPR